MSAPIPINHSTQSASFDGLLNDLLQQQTQFSAVEVFAKWHENQDRTHDLAPHFSVLMPASPLKAGEQYAFEVDLDACSGCKACVVACHNLNNLESDETWRKIGLLTSKESNDYLLPSATLPIVQHVTTACHHCVDPGCLNGCPVKAYEKDPLTGIVKHLDDQCFGCKYCTMMCPYEVPQYSATLGIVRKCDMCYQRLANQEAPACVQACPNKAIRIQSVEMSVIRRRGALTEAALLPTAPPSSITLPSTQFVSKRMIPANVVSAEGAFDELREGHWPLVGMLVLTQASVGLWVLIVTRLFLGTEITADMHWLAICATTLGVVGVHLALLHLGRPQLAYRAFLGWRTSWLSREAIAFGVYMGAAGAATLGLLYSDVLTNWIGSSGFLLMTTMSALLGITAVVCSAMIYVATRRSLWNASRTIGGFLGTSLALGLVLNSLSANSDFIGYQAIAACLVTLAVVAPQLSDVVRFKNESIASPSLSREAIPVASVIDFSVRSGRLIATQLAKKWSAMWALWLTAFVAGLFCFIPSGTSHVFGIVAALCLLLSHAIHRWIYFSAVVTNRMPGAST
jgi:formate dehydrogenase iron-sulfur subunit